MLTIQTHLYAEGAPSQFVITGTTNEEVFLRDITGNRRHLPIRESNITVTVLKRNRDQLLAEVILASRRLAAKALTVYSTERSSVLQLSH
jgi:predicted P-loop ATPase